MKIAAPEYRYQHLGTVYRLIEQFEMISRTDLAKLSGLAPASMTALTKLLIEHQFIIERTTQNLSSRGRPAVGLIVSPLYWSLLCVTLSSTKLTISLCELNGKPRLSEHYPISKADYEKLEHKIEDCILDFLQQNSFNKETLFAVSISVLGKLSSDSEDVLQLGTSPIHCRLKPLFAKFFTQPILINEHFRLWFLTESILGNLIGNSDAIYFQLDNEINLSVLLKGKLLNQDEHKRMNVDKMLMPKFALSDDITQLEAPERYQLKNQITFSALENLIDRYLPHNLDTLPEKIDFFCGKVLDHNPKAEQILSHITDNLAYMLMNLINLFSCEKVMLNSPLLQIKQPLFEQIQQKLEKQLLLDNLNIDLVTSQYSWDSPYIPAIAIKLAIYNGEMLKHIISLNHR